MGVRFCKFFTSCKSPVAELLDSPLGKASPEDEKIDVFQAAFFARRDGHRLKSGKTQWKQGCQIFSLSKHTKLGKTQQMTTNYTKWP
jgi:hypothetical protein